jgi:hypothetical protein
VQDSIDSIDSSSPHGELESGESYSPCADGNATACEDAADSIDSSLPGESEQETLPPNDKPLALPAEAEPSTAETPVAEETQPEDSLPAANTQGTLSTPTGERRASVRDPLSYGEYFCRMRASGLVSATREEWEAMQLEDYEERAAIMEYDGNMPREQAERLAKMDMLRQEAHA